MADLSTDDLFDAAVRILLLERLVTISFDADNTIGIKFPITRRLAKFLGIPHYLILRGVAVMESNGLVKREERVGIVTTGKGSRKMIELMHDKYLQESEELLGAAVLEELNNKIR